MSSLRVDDSRRGRSHSPGDRDDDRDRSHTRVSPNIVNAVLYPSSAVGAFPEPSPTAYEYERLAKWPTGADDHPDYYRGPPRAPPAGDRADPYAEARREVQYRYETDRSRGRDSSSDREQDRQHSDSDREKDRRASMYLPPKYNVKTVEPDQARLSHDSLRDSKQDRESEKERERRRKKEKLENDLAYGKLPGPSKYDPRPEPPSPGAAVPAPPPVTYGYAQPKPWEYDRPPPDGPRYSTTHLDVQGPRPGRTPSPSQGLQRKSSLKKRDDRSPAPPTNRMSTLSVTTPHHSASLSVSNAPASPLLEAYHGTYQSMSPMPSPMMLPVPGNSSSPLIVDALSPANSDDEGPGGSGKRRRRARFADPADDAARLARALRGSQRSPDTEPLIEILPGLTHEQMLELRVEYKRLVKTGTERKGVNVAKHIRLRLKDEEPNLLKACYATALGRWESEAYWANFWYHGDKTRRELLIESLMGRTNEEVRRIKEGFNDKKYKNSLTRCMRTELKEDKFKRAVLMVLEEQRMEERDGYGRPLGIDYRLVDEDVRQLGYAVSSEKGGESAMIAIVVQRSDTHLREVLKAYREKYRANFAKDALRKSGNLVGELLAHILNGVINKPVRDAMLLHHALTASRRDELRRELLISRLVRYHWDAPHMALVKRAFREQYGKDLQDAVREATSGEWGQFCQALCIVRMPDDVRRVERVDIHR